MQRCKQQSDIARNGVDFQSESSAGKTYHVQAFRLDEMDHCTCIAFVMKRNKEAKRLGLSAKGISAAGLASDCKHLQEVRRVTCQWTQKAEDQYRWDGKCPTCGGPLVEEGTPMIPEGADAGEVDDLKAMLAELKPEPEADPAVAAAATLSPDALVEAAAEAVALHEPEEMSQTITAPLADIANTVMDVGIEFWTIVRTSVEAELSETLAPKALAETMQRIDGRVKDALLSGMPPELRGPPTPIDDGSPEAAAAALLEHVR